MDIMLSGVNKYTNKSLITCAITLAIQTLGYRTCLYNPFNDQSYIRKHRIDDSDNIFYDRYKTNIEFANTYKLSSFYDNPIDNKKNKDEINLSRIYFHYKELLENYDAVVSEDTDTLMTPLTDKLLNYEIVKMLDIPIALITSPCHDWFERSLYAINCIQNMGFTLRGIIINRFPHNPDKEAVNLRKHIEIYTNCPVLGVIKEFSNDSYPSTNELAYNILQNIDMSKLLGRKIYYPSYLNF